MLHKNLGAEDVKGQLAHACAWAELERGLDSMPAWGGNRRRKNLARWCRAPSQSDGYTACPVRPDHCQGNRTTSVIQAGNDRDATDNRWKHDMRLGTGSTLED